MKQKNNEHLGSWDFPLVAVAVPKVYGNRYKFFARVGIA